MPYTYPGDPSLLKNTKLDDHTSEERCQDAPAISMRWQDGPPSGPWIELWNRIYRDLKSDHACGGGSKGPEKQH